MLKFLRTLRPLSGNSGIGDNGEFELRKRRPCRAPLAISILSVGEAGYLYLGIHINMTTNCNPSLVRVRSNGSCTNCWGVKIAVLSGGWTDYE